MSYQEDGIIQKLKPYATVLLQLVMEGLRFADLLPIGSELHFCHRLATIRGNNEYLLF